MMDAAGHIGYADMEQSIYREHSRSYADDLPRVVVGAALAQRTEWAIGAFGSGPRLLALDCGGGKLLSNAVERTGVEGHWCSKGSSFCAPVRENQ